MFNEPLPETPDTSQLTKINKAFMIEDATTWVVGTGFMEARLNWFGTFAANSEFFLKVAKPLLSMRTVGSIDVDRKIKLIKHTIMTKKRNCLKDPKGVALSRAQEILKHVTRAKNKKALGKKLTHYKYE